MKNHLAQNKLTVSDLIHTATTQILTIPEDKRFHRFFFLDDETFIYPKPRSECYLIIEIQLISGRKSETKKRLIQTLFKEFQSKLGMDPMDVEIVIFESPPENWGFRGITGDIATLPYPIDNF